MSSDPCERRVVMAKLVALRWLEANTKPEYRLTIYYGAREVRGLPSLLRSFRDGKVKIGNIDPVKDIGIHEELDSFTIWSGDRTAILRLAKWFEGHGFETTGVW